MRKLLFGLIILLLVAPAASSSVGLSEPEIRSTLNQALDVRIPLRGEAARDDSVVVRQASEDRYRREGLDRGRVPGDLQIEVEDGEVQLRTRQPIREPYIGLLLEVRWDGGRSYREISLLFDPPGTLPDDAAPRATDEPAEAAPAPEDSYRVRSGDTLYAIVQRAGLQGVSSEQAMLAFLRENPDAFVDGNVNALRADTELRTPDRDALEAVSAAEAREEIQRQTDDWQARTRPEPDPEEDEEAVDEEPAPEDEEAVEDEEARDEPEDDEEARTEEDEERDEDEAVAAEDDEAVVDDRLEIVADVLPEDEGAAAVADSPEVVQEALLSQRAEMEEMQEEISRMRESLDASQQVAEVASEELATLEQQLAEIRDERAELRDRMEEAEAERDAPLHQRIMNDPLLLMMAIALLVLLVLVLLAFARGGRGGGGPGSGSGRADNSGVKATPDPRTGYEAREDTAEGPTSSTSAMAGAGAAGAAAGAVAVTAGGSAAAEEETPAEPARPGSGDEPAAGEVEESVGEPQPAGEGAGAADTGLSSDDVLAEVDVCLAYGMNDQAVDTLNSAIDGDPDNLSYRLKLVEAFSAQGRQSEMRQAASSLRERLGPEDGEILDKLAELEAGSGDAAPSAGGDAPAGEVAEPAADSGEDVGEFDLSGFADGEGDSLSGEGTEAESDAGELSGGMDFEADEGLDDELAAAAGREQESGGEGGDLGDLGDLSFDIDEADLPSADDSEPAGGDAGSDGPSMDLDELLGEEGGSGAGLDEGTPDLPEADEAPAPAAEGEDDNETRLNLAQAYADMGDQEGAQDLIDEIMASGSEEEKERARAILDQLKDS